MGNIGPSFLRGLVLTLFLAGVIVEDLAREKYERATENVLKMGTHFYCTPRQPKNMNASNSVPLELVYLLRWILLNCSNSVYVRHVGGA
jgi:hypothetical protein